MDINKENQNFKDNLMKNAKIYFQRPITEKTNKKGISIIIKLIFRKSK